MITNQHEDALMSQNRVVRLLASILSREQEVTAHETIQANVYDFSGVAFSYIDLQVPSLAELVRSYTAQLLIPLFQEVQEDPPYSSVNMVSGDSPRHNERTSTSA